MANVFVSYRRDDAQGNALRIADHLRERLGQERVFLDQTSIPDAADWQQALEERLAQTSLLVAVIGPRWLSEEHRRRLADPQDPVRREIATALRSRIAVLPVLVDGARVPDAKDLPEDIRGLARYQALPLVEPYYASGIDRIVRTVEGRALRFPRWILAAAAAAVLASLAFWLPRYWRQGTYVVQVFEAKDGAAVAGALVRVKSLATDEQGAQTTDEAGIARFRLRNGDVLMLGVEVGRDATCRGARLPAFAGTRFPAVTRVDLDGIAERLWGACEATGVAVAATAAFRSAMIEGPVTSLTLASTSPPEVVGDRAFLAEHLPWGTPEAPLIVSRRPYVAGFDPEKKVPRWVGYKLGAHPARPRRADRWQPDPLVPAPSQATSQAYVDNLYDRGALVRRLDVGPEDETAAFYFSVCAPQAERMNRSVWVRIEEAASRQAQRGDVWVLAGTAFVPTGSAGLVYPLLPGNVAVPSHWFRIAVRRLEDGGLDVMGFLVPNTFAVQDDPAPYLAPVTEIEQASGLRFFTGLPAADRDRLRSFRPRGVWTAPSD